MANMKPEPGGLVRLVKVQLTVQQAGVDSNAKDQHMP